MKAIIKSYVHMHNTVTTYVHPCVHEWPQACPAIFDCGGSLCSAFPVDKCYGDAYKGTSLHVGKCVNTNEHSSSNIYISLTSN